jgi:hypothetical protein
LPSSAAWASIGQNLATAISRGRLDDASGRVVIWTGAGGVALQHRTEPRPAVWVTMMMPMREHMSRNRRKTLPERVRTLLN